MRPIALLLSLFAALFPVRAVGAEGEPLRIAVIGLTHGHVEGVLGQARDRGDIEIVGVWDPDRALFDRLKGPYALDDDLYFDDMNAMLDATSPEAASVMTSTLLHLAAVRACAPRGIHVMVEKPLAVSVDHARAMIGLAEEHGVLLLTNYETNNYASVHEAHRITREGAWATPIRRVVFRHGHRGPVEIGCREEFLSWLTNPVQNGGGALFDFGCYGAQQMTWLMDGRRPTSVRATARTLKPETYPRVDDDATIVLTYPGAVGVVQASWAWTHDNKETDIHTEAGSVHCGKWQALSVRRPDQEAEEIELPARAWPFSDEWTMFRAAVRGLAEPDPLAGPEINMIVVQILEAARESVRTGEVIVIGRE